MFNPKMSNENAPFTSKGIAVWYNQGNKLSIVNGQNKEFVQRAEFNSKMTTAKEGIGRANKERLERTKQLAARRKAGTDGQQRF